MQAYWKKYNNPKNRIFNVLREEYEKSPARGLLYFMFMLKSHCLILSKEGDSGKNLYVLKKQKKKICIFALCFKGYIVWKIR